MHRILFLFLVAGLLVFSGCCGLFFPPCDDGNPCTYDIEEEDGRCRHEYITGPALGCEGPTPTGGHYSCVNGACVALENGLPPANQSSLDDDISEWTILVYLGADNNLESAGIDDMNEMERAGSSKEVNIVVEIDRAASGDIWSGYDDSNGDWKGAKRYYITKDGDMQIIKSTELADLGEINMGDPEILLDFMLWGIENYPAKKYALILWNHGAGWDVAVSYDPFSDLQGSVVFDESHEDDALTLPELENTLKQFKQETGITWDIIGFDACLMGQLEVDYAIADYAKVRVSSQESEPGDGWDYESFLTKLNMNPAMDAPALSKMIVYDYLAFYSTKQKDATVTLSAVDLAEAKNFIEGPLDIFSQELLTYMDRETWDEIGKSRHYAEEYGLGYYHSIDLMDFATILSQVSENPNLRNAAEELLEANQKVIIAEAHGPEKKHSQGFSIYFAPSKNEYVRAYTTGIDFPQNIKWGEFLETFYGLQRSDTTAPEVTEIETSSYSMSPTNPLTVYSSVNGNNIVNVELQIYKEYNDEYGNYVVLESNIPYEPPSYELEDGTFISEWIDGENPFIAQWNGYANVMVDDETYTFVELLPVERGSDLYYVTGEYTPHGSLSSFEASIVFDYYTGELIYIWDVERVREVTPHRGDRFGIYKYIYDVDTEEEYYSIVYEDMSYGEEGWWLEWQYMYEGPAYLAVSAEDLSGNSDLELTEINIEPYTPTDKDCYEGTPHGYCSAVEPGYSCFNSELIEDETCFDDWTCVDGTQDGYCSEVYDGYWCNAGTLEYDEYCISDPFACADGTLSGECTTYDGFICINGEFEWSDDCYFGLDYSCEDGTENGFCSVHNPGYYCFYGELDEDEECIGSCSDGTPNEYCSFTMDGYICWNGHLEQSDYCSEEYMEGLSCEDGTPDGYCSDTQDGYWCNNGILEYDEICLSEFAGADCADGTPDGYCSEVTPGLGCWDGELYEYEECGAEFTDCSDGTKHGYCSTKTQGYFCWGGELLEDEECIGSCSDGTPNGYCSYSKEGYACWDGQLEPASECY